MNKGLVIFEDSNFADFYPLTWLRPIYFLRPGIRYQFEKIIDYFKDYKPHLFCRPELAELTSTMTKYPVNKFERTDFEELTFVNGRLCFTREFAEALQRANKNAVLYYGEDIAAFKKIGPLTEDEIGMLNEGDLGQFLDHLKGKAQTLEVELPMYNYLWDFVGSINDEIADDFEHFKNQPDQEGFRKSGEQLVLRGDVCRGVEMINADKIYIAPDVEILPGVVLDATHGPVFIGSKVKIEPNSYIIGPTYIGRESHVVGGKIAESSIGPVCRVGGEVEATIIQGYTNKYHAGFIGHSYLGEWINLGAMTTNSDLKNNYSNVKVSLNGDLIDTGRMKVGSFIGDFSRTSIGALLNTGINIGIVCNIIAGEIVAEREIPPFTWYQASKAEPYNPARAFETIEKAMSRRDVKMSLELSKRLESIAPSARIQ
jgi:UDP-N-acetylglucosamine diphosphorylase/glucosamine-1-phosphate N-acetyltransferase